MRKLRKVIVWLPHISFLSGLRNLQGKNGSVRIDLCLHTHADFSELVIVLSGTATHVVDGEEYPIRKGDVFVISNNTAHGYKHPKNFHICNIMFHLSYFLDYQSDIKTTAGFHALFVIEPTLTKTQGFKRQLINVELSTI